MRITIFNDTEMDWNIHSCSVQPISGTSWILRHTGAIFEGLDDSELFVKVWNGLVMVSFGEHAAAEGIHYIDPPYVNPKIGTSRV